MLENGMVNGQIGGRDKQNIPLLIQNMIDALTEHKSRLEKLTAEFEDVQNILNNAEYIYFSTRERVFDEYQKEIDNCQFNIEGINNNLKRKGYLLD